MRFNHRQRRAVRKKEVADLNITAFMNLMVVLVPFLLITAVFTRTAILELSIPATENVLAEQPPPRPQIHLYADRLEWGDGQSELRNVAQRTDGSELIQLRDWLIRYQGGSGDNTEALLLVAPDVDYESLIAVMDHIRSHPADKTGEEPQPLFPDISLGDAP